MSGADAAAKASEVDPRRIRLQRMRAGATGLLAGMAALYALSFGLAGRWSGAGYLRAFSEAAIVGGVADWFAVTALFRHPLGLPIPHTALVPRSQARIGAAFGRFFTTHFLSAPVLEARLRSVQATRWCGRWLGEPGRAEALAAHIAGSTPRFLRLVPDGVLETLFAGALRTGIGSVPTGPLAAAVLNAATREGRADALIDWGAERLGRALTEHEAVILEKVQAQSWRWLPAWVDRAIARKITAGLVQLLSDVRQPDHPWRTGLGHAVETWTERLAHDPEIQARADALRDRLLASAELERQGASAWGALRRRLEDGLLAQPEPQRWMAARLRGLAAWLRQDAAPQRRLDAAARRLVQEALSAGRGETAGRLVAQVVESWDSASLVDRLELLVGPDLQYIRINGALVGGAVGLLLYSASRLLRLG